jgi:uncharacterized membrane protein
VIPDAIVSLVRALLAPVFSVLPTFSLASYFPTTQNLVDEAAQMAALGNGFAPIYEMAYISSVVLNLVLPATVGYLVANWVYRHIPEVAGFGPGAG